MNLETKITIYKFTPQVFTLTLTNFNTYPEASRSSEIPEFIKNSQQQASAR